MILITGATGNVGREMIRQLNDSGEPIRVLTRNPEKVSIPSHVEIVSGDLTNPESLKEALTGVRRVFMIHVPGSDKFPEVAEQSGVEHIVFLSAAAIDYPNNAIGLDHLYFEELIKKTGVKWTFLRPGAFMSNTLQWAHSIKHDGIVRAPFGDVVSNPIDPRDIAAVAVKSLKTSGHDNKIYTLTGPELLSQREQVSILANVLGQNIHFENIPKDVAAKKMKQFIPDRIVDASLDLMENTTGHSIQVLETVKKVTGRDGRSFRQWAYDHADLFR